MKKRILVVVAHPDDEVLGCGGTIARLVKEGYEAFTLILGEGVTSRGEGRDQRRQEKELAALKKQMAAANKVLGVKRVFSYGFPDNLFDSLPLLDIVKGVEKAVKAVKPALIFTHHQNDLNVDHRITFQAVLTACRPLQGSPVKQICAFETLSSTEWSWPNDFRPNYYINITDVLSEKVKAMNCYRSETRPWPHPRSGQAIKALAAKRGSEAGMKNAEAFEIIRMLN
jgi:LmbE family N-acetylglucosaminyl deacetylase